MIIKQPNGLYCIYDTTIDDIVLHNASKEELVEYYINQSKITITNNVEHSLKKLNNNEQKSLFRLSYNEAIETIEQIHGKGRVEQIQNLINNEY